MVPASVSTFPRYCIDRSNPRFPNGGFTRQVWFFFLFRDDDQGTNAQLGLQFLH